MSWNNINSMNEQLMQLERDIEFWRAAADEWNGKAESAEDRIVLIEGELQENLIELQKIYSILSAMDQEDLMKSEPEICQEILAGHDKGRV